MRLNIRKIASLFFLRAHQAASLSTQNQQQLHAQRCLNVYYDSSNNLHRDISYHPECPERVSVCVDALNAYTAKNTDTGKNILLQDIAQDQDFFTDEELIHARRMLVKAHSENYVEQIERKCRDSKARRVEEGKGPLGFIGYVDTGDTFITTETYGVCLRATAAWIRAVDDAISGDNAAVGFALTRPPGHHATRSLSNGFCHFNFAAAATLYATEKGKTVSVLDWDVHYGQGVANILQNEPKARYVSLHQYPAFPYEGERRRTTGSLNNIMTIPIAVDSTWTCGYRELFENHVLPFLFSDDNKNDSTIWKPDLILVCAGYDALADDELASVNLEPSDYGKMVTLVEKRMSDTFGEGNRPALAFGMEGGYRLQNEGERGLSAAFIETIKALL